MFAHSKQKQLAILHGQYGLCIYRKPLCMYLCDLHVHVDLSHVHKLLLIGRSVTRFFPRVISMNVGNSKHGIGLSHAVDEQNREVVDLWNN